MKRATKKLVLHRETLRRLNDSDLENLLVAGGCVRGECSYYCETGPVLCPATEPNFTC